MVLVAEFPNLPDHLSIFGPTNFRANRNQAEFQNLKGVTLTISQCDYFSIQCLGLHEENNFDDIKFGISGNELKRRYNIPIGTANFWIAKFKSTNKSEIVRKQGRGRPTALDSVGIAAACAEIQLGTAEKKGGKTNKRRLMDLTEVSACLSKHARITSRRAGHDVDVEDDQIILSPKTIKRIMKVRSY